MKSYGIKKESSFAFLEEACRGLHKHGPSSVSRGVVAVLADRIRAAIEASENASIDVLTEQLAEFYQVLFSTVSPAARDAARGVQGNDDAAAAFLLGQAAFAHLVAARTLDRRADDRFLRTIRDGRYERYVRSLQREPLNGTRLGELVGEREETVSRKLAILRQLGIVSSRKEGTSVVNSLTPAARGVLEHFRIAPLATSTAQASSVQQAVSELRDELDPYLQEAPSFGELVSHSLQQTS